MASKKLIDALPELTNDQLVDVWGGANRQHAMAERERIAEMQRLRPRVDGWNRGR
jgi:hypothetical protein